MKHLESEQDQFSAEKPDSAGGCAVDVRGVNYASSPLAAQGFWGCMDPECCESAVRCLPWSCEDYLTL